MNKSLYNKIITSVSKVIKKSINEAYDTSIYDNLTSILNRCKEETKQGERDR